MFKRHIILSMLFVIILFMVAVNEGKKKGKRKTKFGPKAMSFNHSTTCDEFSKNARFNPYSVLFVRWFVFYYWDFPQPPKTYLFTFPSSNLTQKLHKIFDGKVTKPVNWTSRLVLMDGPGPDISLLVERGDRGQYWQYFIRKVVKELIEPYDVRLKQTGDGRILGIMNCKHETVHVMSKINEVPPKNRLQEEAAKLGFRSRRGKSYLYQGHEWMPIPEADDTDMWLRPEDMYTNNEIIDSESKPLKNLKQEKLENVTFTNESSKSQSNHKLNESHYNHNVEISQAVDIKKQTSNYEASQVTNNFEVTNENLTAIHIIDNSKENLLNASEHSRKQKKSIDHIKNRVSDSNTEGIQFTNINKPLQSTYFYDSTSTTKLKEVKTGSSYHFTEKSIEINTIIDVDKHLNYLETEKEPSILSANLVADDAWNTDENVSINKQKSQSDEILKYSDDTGNLQSIDDLLNTDTDDSNSPFDPTDILDLESGLSKQHQQIKHSN